MSRMRHSRGGMTLIELLTVVFIIMILMALLLPALGVARARARRIKATGEVRELAKAWEQYWVTYSNWPFASSEMNPGAVAILQGNNPLQIRFMDFGEDAELNGFRDPWGNLYWVTLSEQPGTPQRLYFSTRVFLQNRKRYEFD